MKFLRAILLAAAASALCSKAQGQVANGIKAVVHDSVVTYQEVEALTAPFADDLRRQFRGDPEGYNKKITEALNDNMDQLVERQLVLHEFKAAGYQMPEGVIDNEVRDRIHSRFGDRAKLTKTLQAQGLTFEKFRNDVRDQIIVEALRGKNICRFAVVGVAAVAAVITPPDPISMLAMCIPLFGLYEVAVAAVWLLERSRAKASASTDIVP